MFLFLMILENGRNTQKNMLEEHKCVNALKKKRQKYKKIMTTGWLQNKQDRKGFASYEGLSNLFKIYKG